MTVEAITTGEQGDTSAPQPLIDVDPVPPAPAADEQKTDAKPADGADDKTETPEQQEQKKESRRQRAIRRERDARVSAETENRILRERLAATETKAAPVDAEPKREDFDDYEAYLRAATKYDAKQAAAETLKADRDASQGQQKQSKQTAEQEATAKSWVEREKAFISTTPDYEANVTPYVEHDLGQLSDGARRLILDAGPALLDHLARNEDVHDRIAGLSPLRQVAELGKLEAGLETKVKPQGKKLTTAPDPITPVEGGKSASNGYSENMSDAQYATWRKANGARWAH